MAYDNYGGFTALWVAEYHHLTHFRGEDGKVSRTGIAFKPGKYWRKIGLVRGSGSIRERGRKAKQGQSFDVQGQAKLLQDTEERREELLEIRQEVVVALRDNNGKLKVYGSPEEPLTLTYTLSKGKKVSSENGYSLSIRGKITKLSAFIDDLGRFISLTDAVLQYLSNKAFSRVRVSEPYYLSSDKGDAENVTTTSSFTTFNVSEYPANVTLTVSVPPEGVNKIDVIWGKVQQFDFTLAINKKVYTYTIKRNDISEDQQLFEALVEHLQEVAKQKDFVRFLDIQNVVGYDENLLLALQELASRNVLTNTVMLTVNESYE